MIETFAAGRRTCRSGAAPAPPGTGTPPLKEIEMRRQNWKPALLLAAMVGMLSAASSGAIAQSDAARQQPQGLHDADTARQQPHGLRDADTASQQPKGVNDADAARQQPQGLRDGD